MPASDVGIVAFGRPERDDPQSSVLTAAAALGASTKLVTSSEGEDFSSMDHGSIDWGVVLEGSSGRSATITVREPSRSPKVMPAPHA